MPDLVKVKKNGTITLHTDREQAKRFYAKVHRAYYAELQNNCAGAENVILDSMENDEVNSAWQREKIESNTQFAEEKKIKNTKKAATQKNSLHLTMLQENFVKFL